MFYILFLSPFVCFADIDSLSIQFAEDEKKLSPQHIKLIQDKIQSRPVGKIEITAFIGSEVSISENRINTLYRLQSIQNVLILNAVQSNLIYTKRELTETDSLFNRITIVFVFLDNKEEGIIFKTKNVTIRENDLPERNLNIPKRINVKKIDSPKVVKKPAVKKKKILYGGLYDRKDFIKDSTVMIPELLFYATSHRLKKTSYLSLRYLTKFLMDYPTLKVEVQGHICCKKNGADGMDFDTPNGYLSENRAKVIYYYLIQHGIHPSRLSHKGFGSSRKIVEDNGNAIKGKKNRRVELFIIEE